MIAMTTSPGPNAGTGGWTLFEDALEEAGVRGRRKKRIGRPKRQLADVTLAAIKTIEGMRRRLDRDIRKQSEDWLPTQQHIRAATELAGALVKLERSVRLGREAERNAMGSLTDEQMEQVLISNLTRVASVLTELQWRTLLAAGLGEDIAEAALHVWKRRRAETESARATTCFKRESEG
jgi:hypothetical protein